MKGILAALLVLLLAVPVVADITLGPGGSVVRLIEDGVVTNAGDILAEVEFTREWGRTNEIGLVASYHGDEFVGLGVRYYMSSAGGGVHPGIGAAVLSLGTDTLSEDTILLGGEILLGLDVYYGGKTIPLKAFAGWYPSVDGAEATMYRYGIMVPMDPFK